MRCLSPIPLYFGKDQYGPIVMRVPCGHCLNCLSNIRQAWGARMNCEQKYSDITLFIALTYNNDHIPYDPEHSVYCLSKTDCQNFIKRLRTNVSRKLSPDITLRYYLCGEYGDTFKRPHYHVILFLKHSSDPDFIHKNYGKLCYCIELAWNIGIADIQIAGSNGAFMYSAKYILKKSEIQDDPYLQKLYFTHPPFSLKSQGLGRDYINDNRYFFEDGKTYLPVDNYKIPLPRYFRNKLNPRTENLTPIQLRALSNCMAHQDDQRYNQLKRNFLTTHTEDELPIFDYEYSQDISEYITRYYQKVKSKKDAN